MATIVAVEILGSGRLAGRHLGVDEIRHTLERHLKRIEAGAASFQGKILSIEQTLMALTFSSLSEAGLAAIEIQHRVSDLPPVSGVHLNVRIGIHMAETEEEARSVAIQLVRLALPEQILCGREILLDQVHSVGISVRDLRQMQLEDGRNFHVVEVLWHENKMPISLTATSVISISDHELEVPDEEAFSEIIEPVEQMPALVVPVPNIKNKLCVRYSGKAFLLDEKTPFLTLGREPNNDLIINDSRVSRQHARIERKDDQYYLVDMSTNGTFVAQSDKPEAFLRKSRLLLEGQGTLNFAISAHRDQSSQQVEFEFL